MTFKKGEKTSLQHGHRIDSNYSSTYNSWRALKGRCNNPKNCRYIYYGLLGITYDPRWHFFKNFLEDMGVKPNGTELHRHDKKGNYTKDNCLWLDKETHKKIHDKERDYSTQFKKKL